MSTNYLTSAIKALTPNAGVSGGLLTATQYTPIIANLTKIASSLQKNVTAVQSVKGVFSTVDQGSVLLALGGQVSVISLCERGGQGLQWMLMLIYFSLWPLKRRF